MGPFFPFSLIRSDSNRMSDAESGLISKEKKRISESRCDLNNVRSERRFLPDCPAHICDGFLRRVGRSLAGRLREFFIPSSPLSCWRERIRCLLVGAVADFSPVILGATCGYIVATLCGILGGNYFAKIISPKVISIAGSCSSSLSRRWHSLPSFRPPDYHLQGFSCLFTNKATKQTLTPLIRPFSGSPHLAQQTRSCHPVPSASD